MRVTIAAVGRLKSGPETDLADRYRKRFEASGRGLGLGPVAIIELPEARGDSVDLRQKDEADRLLARIPEDSHVCVLDETGLNKPSEQFANWLAATRDDGVSEVAFLVGGPDGHGEATRTRANILLSLGAMTLPHGLARVILLEQLYRATTILSRHPYHRA